MRHGSFYCFSPILLQQFFESLHPFEARQKQRQAAPSRMALFSCRPWIVHVSPAAQMLASMPSRFLLRSYPSSIYARTRFENFFARNGFFGDPGPCCLPTETGHLVDPIDDWRFAFYESTICNVPVFNP
jgi:hypothetical protein